MQKISCGGFILDGETLQEKDGVLSVIGGGSGGSDVYVVGLEIDAQQESANLDKTYNEIKEAYDSGKIIKGVFDLGYGESINADLLGIGASYGYYKCRFGFFSKPDDEFYTILNFVTDVEHPNEKPELDTDSVFGSLVFAQPKYYVFTVVNNDGTLVLTDTTRIDGKIFQETQIPTHEAWYDLTQYIYRSGGVYGHARPFAFISYAGHLMAVDYIYYWEQNLVISGSYIDFESDSLTGIRISGKVVSDGHTESVSATIVLKEYELTEVESGEAVPVSGEE